MKKNFLKVIAAAALLAVSLVFIGCGDDSKDDDKPAAFFLKAGVYTLGVITGTPGTLDDDGAYTIATDGTEITVEDGSGNTATFTAGTGFTAVNTLVGDLQTGDDFTVASGALTAATASGTAFTAAGGVTPAAVGDGITAIAADITAIGSSGTLANGTDADSGDDLTYAFTTPITSLTTTLGGTAVITPGFDTGATTATLVIAGGELKVTMSAALATADSSKNDLTYSAVTLASNGVTAALPTFTVTVGTIS